MNSKKRLKHSKAVEKKLMLSNKIIIGLTCILLIIIGGFILKDLIKQHTKTPQSAGEPIYDFTGYIENVGKDYFTVHNGTTIRFNIVKNTVIYSLNSPVPYLFKDRELVSQKKLSLSELKPKELVEIKSFDNLRTIDANGANASAVRLISSVNRMTGMVKQVENDTIILKDITTDTPEKIKKEEILVHLTPDTEISQNIYTKDSPTVAQPILFEKETIKDHLVTVYVQENILSSNIFTALRVEIIPSVPLPEPTVILK